MLPTTTFWSKERTALYTWFTEKIQKGGAFVDHYQCYQSFKMRAACFTGVRRKERQFICRMPPPPHAPKKVPTMLLSDLLLWTCVATPLQHLKRTAIQKCQFTLPPVHAGMMQLNTEQRIFVVRERKPFICVKLFCFNFAVLCHLADGEIVLIPPFTQLNSQRQHNARSKQQVYFFGTPCKRRRNASDFGDCRVLQGGWGAISCATRQR